MPAECRHEATLCLFSKASICIGAQQISEVDVGISELPSVEWPQLLRDFDNAPNIQGERAGLPIHVTFKFQLCFQMVTINVC